MENQIKSLEAELKLLRWHKLANESALKAAILKDKQTKRSDNRVPQLLHDTNKFRLNSVIEDERSRDLIVRESWICITIICTSMMGLTTLVLLSLQQVDDAFVRQHEEFDRRNEEAARRQLLFQRKRLHAIQMKAENARMLRSRKQKCLQIEAGPARHDDDVQCTSIDEQTDAMEDTTINQALVVHTKARESKSSKMASEERAMLLRSQSLPAHLWSSNAAAGKQTKLHFTKLQSKSGPGEPSRPYYCVRVDKKKC